MVLDLVNNILKIHQNRHIEICIAPLITSETVIDGKEMRYVFDISSVEGKKYHFQGTKYVKKEARVETGWGDTTILYVRIFEGERQPDDAPITTGTHFFFIGNSVA